MAKRLKANWAAIMSTRLASPASIGSKCGSRWPKNGALDLVESYLRASGRMRRGRAQFSASCMDVGTGSDGRFVDRLRTALAAGKGSLNPGTGSWPVVRVLPVLDLLRGEIVRGIGGRRDVLPNRKYALRRCTAAYRGTSASRTIWAPRRLSS